MVRLLAAALVSTLGLSAAIDDWENLRALRPGERVWVRHREGKTIRHREGVASHWAADSITIQHKGKDLTIARADLVKLSVYAGKSRAKGAGYGALVGAAAGAAVYGAVALAADGLDVSPALMAAGGALLIGGAGAAVGAMIGATKTRTVYQAQVP